jgi:hypothetical protein
VQWTLAATTVGLAFAGITWVAGANHHGAAPHGNYEPQRLDAWTYSEPDAAERRQDALARAAFEIPDHTNGVIGLVARHTTTSDHIPTCRFARTPLSGTSAKFDCVFDGGDVVKVKYGRNPEIHAEVAATRLLQRLGYPADSVTIVHRLRCYGCPRFPFEAMYFEDRFGLPLVPLEGDEGYTDFDWVAVERKFPAHPIETETQKGWAWWELEKSLAPRADIDALRLTAVFLAHWDNKDVNQRLVCLDGPPPGPNAPCERPLAMIQDLGATFGPSKVNLARWRAMPIWRDRHACTVSMAALPFQGASFPDGQISEGGRAKLASRLTTITDDDVERLFADARFPQFQVGTDDTGDLKAWAAAFRHRADEITTARCPEVPAGS